jgi:membrane protein YqaA with SNARE-associated domain
MTTSHFAIAGAAILNLPTLFAASLLPAGAVAVTAVLLAATGAALGALVGWAITRGGEVAATARVEPADAERIAA